MLINKNIVNCANLFLCYMCVDITTLDVIATKRGVVVWIKVINFQNCHAVFLQATIIAA